MKIAITGGTGFVGTALTKKLLKDNEISILTRKIPNKKLPVKYFEISYFNKEQLRNALKGQDLIIHLAATLFARTRKDYFKNNQEIAKNITEIANELNIKKIINISSLAAGGPVLNNKERNEEIIDEPISAYGQSKLKAEKELENFKNELVILRPPIIYGPRDFGFSKIAEWVKKGIMVVPGSSKTLFSFVYIEDLVNVIEEAIKIKFEKREKFYICENKVYEWETFIKNMAKEMKVKNPKMLSMPKTLLPVTGFIYEIISYFTFSTPVFNRDKAKEAISGNWICSSKKWEEFAKFKNWTSLEEGLKKSFS